jgi:hypothetical protein
VSKSPASDKSSAQRKEKKNVFGKIFGGKRNKKQKDDEDDDSNWLAKETATNRQSPTPKMSSESTPSDISSVPSSPQKVQSRQPGSKLTKNPPQKSNSFNKGTGKGNTHEPTISPPQLEAPSTISPLKTSFGTIEEESEHDRGLEQPKPALQINTQSPTRSNGTRSPTETRGRNILSPIGDVMGGSNFSQESQPEKVKKAVERMPLDDFDDDQDDIFAKPHDGKIEHHGSQGPANERLSESPVHVSPSMNDLQSGYPNNGSSYPDGENGVNDSRSSTPELVEKPAQDVSGPSNVTTPTSSTPSSKKDTFSWARCKKWFDEEFDSWYTCLMDVSEEMKDFNWKEHWAYKEFGEDILEYTQECIDEMDWSLVDYYDWDERAAEGKPQLHPPYRSYGWEKSWMRYEQECQIKGVEPEWLPWNDPRYAYLYPHRPSPPGAATGPPEGFIRRPAREMKIIGPSALTEKLPRLDIYEPKGFAPKYVYPFSNLEEEKSKGKEPIRN